MRRFHEKNNEKTSPLCAVGYKSAIVQPALRACCVISDSKESGKAKSKLECMTLIKGVVSSLARANPDHIVYG